MDRNLSPSTSNLNDRFIIKETNDFAFQIDKDNFLHNEMKQELIQVLAKKEAIRLLKKTSLREISRILDKQSKFNRKVF